MYHAHRGRSKPLPYTDDQWSSLQILITDHDNGGLHMKRITAILLTLILTAALMTACGEPPLTLDQTALSLTVG